MKRGMLRILKSLLPLFLTLFVMMLSVGFYMTFASLRVSAGGASNIIIGLIGSAYYVGMMLGSVTIEKLIERIGHIRSFAFYAALNVLAVILQEHLLDPGWWLVFRFILGMCCASYFIVIESWMLLSSTPTTRGKLLSFYMLVLYLGQGSGQFFLNFVQIESAFPFSLAIMLTAIALIPIALIKGTGPVHIETKPLGLIYLFTRSPLGAIGCFIAGLTLSSFYGLGPIFGKEMGYTQTEISLMMGCTIISGLILQWPLGHLSDIFDRPKVMIGTCAALIVVCVLLYQFERAPFHWVLGMCVLYGGLSFTMYPLSISHTCDSFSPYLIVKITCSLLVIYGIGCIFGPVIAASVMNVTSPGGIFLYAAVLTTILMCIAIYRVATGKTVRAHEQGEYMPLPRMTSLVNYLYPRERGIDIEMDDDDDDE